MAGKGQNDDDDEVTLPRARDGSGPTPNSFMTQAAASAQRRPAKTMTTHGDDTGAAGPKQGTPPANLKTKRGERGGEVGRPEG